MPEHDHSALRTPLEHAIARLARGDLAARDELIAIACERMRDVAHRMLRGFPRVRRFDETDDVVQNASLRLYKALASICPSSAEHFLNLASTHIRRELIDLARKHGGPESYAANHETNYLREHDRMFAKVDAVASDATDTVGTLDNWTRLHEAAERLPDGERELFHLVWYMGAKQEEAARILGCSTRTIKRRWDSVKTLIDTSLNGQRPG